MSKHALNDYLSSAADLQSLIEHAKYLGKLQRLFEKYVPHYLAPLSRIANIKQGILVIFAANSAVASKLKQLEPSLHEAFLNNGCQLTQIQIKIQPAWTHGVRLGVAQQSKRLAPPVPASTRESLNELATQLPPDNTLRKSLEGLLKRSR